MTLVKICGVTNLRDAGLVCEFGADIIGLNFYEPSPRCISPGMAAEIIQAFSDQVKVVGVFVNEPFKKVANIIDQTGIHSVQLHGDETPEYTDRLRKELDVEIVKAFRVSPGFNANDIDRYEVDAILLDGFSPHLYGGSGELSDWSVASLIVDRFPRVYLAGGLRPENVENAVRSVRPYAVDAASGVEAEDGRKDPQKVERFIRRAKQA